MEDEKKYKELAVQYGIPLPETCVNLDWKYETFFVWVKRHDGFKLCFIDGYNEVFISVSDYQCADYECNEPTYYAAPQMHEIALPRFIMNQTAEFASTWVGNEYQIGYYTNLSHNEYRVFEWAYIDDVEFYEIVHDCHFDEAYARLCTKLRNAGELYED